MFSRRADQHPDWPWRKATSRLRLASFTVSGSKRKTETFAVVVEAHMCTLAPLAAHVWPCVHPTMHANEGTDYLFFLLSPSPYLLQVGCYYITCNIPTCTTVNFVISIRNYKFKWKGCKPTFSVYIHDFTSYSISPEVSWKYEQVRAYFSVCSCMPVVLFLLLSLATPQSDCSLLHTLQ